MSKNKFKRRWRKFIQSMSITGCETMIEMNFPNIVGLIILAAAIGMIGRFIITRYEEGNNEG
jgi:hypothetical protein